MKITTKYYRMACWWLLKDFIPYTPDLKLTNAKSYMGRINIKNQVIRISKFHHIDALWSMDNEDRYEIINTICHELAHTIIFQRDNLHRRLTKAFMTMILCNTEIAKLEQKLKRGANI